MSFGNQSGPPASDKQVRYLLTLVRQAGYDGFRDARHPLGLTQRQAAGKFSLPEASALIDRLLATTEETEREGRETIEEFPTDVIAAELARRGWTVTPPV